MSKKVFNVFSILCFALVLCFIGCTELINPKTETDINLNIDLSKIIKSTRNTEETQSSASLGENPTIKVAIYDAKKYNATTNSTDNLDLITEAQAQIVNNEAKVKLNNIPVGIDAIVFAELSFSNGNSTEVMYAGNSEVFRVKPTDNKISLVLIKVEVDIEVDIEVKPDDSNTPYEKFTLFQKNSDGKEVTDITGASIETSSTAATKVIVTNPQSSDSVWTYFVKPNNNTRFTESANYKVSVELKADKTTVVGIAAARADYFFTVNSDWTPCEFETGYLIGNENHQFTIGLGLSSEIEIKNLKIEKLETTYTTEPSLVFDISKYAIETYLGKTDKATKIIDVSKLEGNAGYTITINTPMCHSTGNSTGNSTGTDDSYIQDVKLHLRSYATNNTGANNVSFNITNNGNDFETSVMADTANEKSTAWNNNATKISDGNFSVDFPNYKANDELIVGLITTSTFINNSTSFTLSNFKVEKAGYSPFSYKIFAIQVDDNWTKIEVGAAFSKEIGAHNSIDFDVLMFNKDAWFDENNSLDETTALKEATRFVLDGDDIASDLAEKFIYSTLSNESGNPIYNLKNDFDEDKTVQIKLNENYEVVIEEITSNSGGGNSLNEILSWEELVTKIDSLSDATTTEFIIMNDLTATSTITVNKPVKIISDKNVTITRGNSLDGVNFEDSFFGVESAGNLELVGTLEKTITLDGGNANDSPILATAPLITSSGNLTLTNCTLQNNTLNSTVPVFGNGGAVYVSGGTFTMNGVGTISHCNAENGGAVYVSGGTFKMNGGTITECSATDSGGGVWMNGGSSIWEIVGSSFTMSGDSKIDICNSNSEGGGVYVTDSSNLCTFKMLDEATITNCTAENGGGVSYGCGLKGTFEISGNAKINSNISSYCGGGIYLYGILTMDGGTISGNKAPSGAGVYVRDGSSSFTMNGGKISDNNATESGAGVYLSDSTSSFTMTYGTISNNLVNNENNGASIYNVAGTVTILNTSLGQNQEFTQNIIDGEVDASSGTGGNTGTSVTSISTNVLANGGDFVVTTADGSSIITITETIEISSNVSLSSESSTNKITLKRADSFNKGPMFMVKSGGTLILSDIILDGGASFSFTEADLVNKNISNCISGIAADDGPLIYNNGGNIELNSGSVLQNNWMVYSSAIEGGAGIFMDGGTAVMNGAEIKNNYGNTNTVGGGGVYIKGGDFTINSGVISGNYCTKRGGGVSITSSQSPVIFTMNGGSITNNACATFGGALTVYENSSSNGATIKLNVGEISNNYALANGGGVYLFLGNAQSTGYIGNGVGDEAFIISKNTVAYSGSSASGVGLYIHCSALNDDINYFEIKKGTDISNNNVYNSSAKIQGLGVWLQSGNILMSGGTIHSNKEESSVELWGGGIYVNCDKFTMTGGSVTSNSLSSSTSSAHGQQIYFVGTTDGADKTMIINGTTYSTETSLDENIEIN